MSSIIRQFYSDYKLPERLIEQKIKVFDRHPDIASEFEYWIANKRFKEIDAVIVDGYSAEKLASISSFLKGDGAFMLLIELRESPDKAKSKIASGFKMK